uniref:Uncharacterized protein n=1 Tax=Ciona intestinalis TaxID=7719 RepID=H2XMP9_CIOIN
MGHQWPKYGLGNRQRLGPKILEVNCQGLGMAYSNHLVLPETIYAIELM